MTIQPDLFGEHDAAQERSELWKQPCTCPRCGEHCTNRWILRNNHAIDPDTDTIGGYPRGQHPIYGAMCLAQSLAEAHLIADLRYGNPAIAQPRPRNIKRARQLGLDVDTIIATAIAALEGQDA